jgi:hypothetical protein
MGRTSGIAVERHFSLPGCFASKPRNEILLAIVIRNQPQEKRNDTAISGTAPA